MSLAKFSEIIDRGKIGASVSKRQELIEQTDPKRIYVENIRSFFGLSTKVARWLLEFAVRQGVLEKRVGILCPNSDCNRMITDFPANEEPAEISCEVCEIKGEEESSFKLDKCKKMEFYRVKG